MFQTPGDNGLVYSYATSQMLYILWNTSIIAFIMLALLIILLMIKKWVNEKPKKFSVIESEASEETLAVLPKPDDQVKVELGALEVSTSILFYGLLLIISFMVSIIHGFEHLGTTALVKVTTCFITVAGGVILHIIWRYFQYKDPKQFFKTLKTLKGKKLIGSFIALIIWMLLVGGMFFTFNGICYCIYNDNYGDFATKHLISTSLSRRIHLPSKICQNQDICRVYATLPEDGSTSVFLNIHTGIHVKNLNVQFQLFDQKFNYTDLYKFHPKFQEQFGERIVWSYLFTGLTPKRNYNISITNQFGKQIKTTYKTFAAFGDQTSFVNLIVGGDVGLESFGRELFAKMTQLEKPDLIIIGGDVTYDNAMTYCYYSWDNLYVLLDQINYKRNQIIPFILALGNHDVGFNGLAKVKVSISDAGPWWFTYNPQHLANGDNKVPIPKDRKGYGYHVVGSTVFIILDSGYIQTYENQAKYLEQIAAKFYVQNYSLIAVYHVPLYPSCFHEYKTHGQSEQALILSRKYYQPLFNKYNIAVCFQHHVHKFKRTIPINGTVYIGDGNLGVDSTACPASDLRNQSIMAKTLFEGSRHYWRGQLTPKKLTLEAIGINGTEIDSTEIIFQK